MAAKFGSSPRGRRMRPLFGLSALLVACSGQVSGPVGAFQGQQGASDTPGSANQDDKGNPGVSKAPLDCASLHVGYTPLQRISRDQYTNSVRDLLGVSFDQSMLSDDERVGVFDGNVVAPVTDLLVDEYASAAERVAQQALPNLEKLVSCDRAAQGDDKCAAQFIDTFGTRVYRRPLSADEQAAYVALFGEYKGTGYPAALRVLVQTMLQSPNFLYRVELQPVAAGKIEGTQLDAFELASRLSFFLLSTTPDELLLKAAESGELLTSDGLSEQTERLIEDPRFSDTLASFHTHWLELQKLGTSTKDSTIFPMFSSNVAAQMLDETLKFVDHVIRKDDAKLETLLTASYGFPQAELAKLYGVTPAATPDEPVQFDPTQRAGLLTQPSFLAAHAHYNSTSPVERGKIVIRNVLCQVLPDPPPDVNTTPPNPESGATIREGLAVHQQVASCAGCHKRIDGIGLGFEQFDAIGAYRTTENGKPVDSSGEVVQGGSDINGKFGSSMELVQKLAGSSEVKECVATQWLRFALGRVESDADQCTLDKLFKDFAGSDHDIRVLLESIVLSDAFRNKRVAAVSP
ncbi:MAG TPA: DUF1592 domain-containing protein [Polyangiales bacterium]|nr:DUF1592 domain-containing protein [Polyangiales bacterium]